MGSVAGLRLAKDILPVDVLGNIYRGLFGFHEELAGSPGAASFIEIFTGIALLKQAVFGKANHACRTKPASGDVIRRYDKMRIAAQPH
jgi:hypothetical protein